MDKTFADALGDLIAEYSTHTPAAEMLTELELQVMALKECLEVE